MVQSSPSLSSADDTMVSLKNRNSTIRRVSETEERERNGCQAASFRTFKSFVMLFQKRDASFRRLALMGHMASC